MELSRPIGLYSSYLLCVCYMGTVVSFEVVRCGKIAYYTVLYRSVTLHDRPAKMFADLDHAGRHKLFHRLDIFQYVLFQCILIYCYCDYSNYFVKCVYL